MINVDELVSILIDDDSDKLAELIGNIEDHTFHIKKTKYKYTKLLELSEGAPLISIAAYFGSSNCYEYLINTETFIPNFKYPLFAYACAGGNMGIIRDVESKDPDCLNEDKKSLTDYYRNPGFQAIYHGNLDVVKWLLLKGYDFESAEFYACCLQGYENIFDFLMENCKLVEKMEQLYDDLIFSACDGGNEKILMKLMTKYPQKKISKVKYQNFINNTIRNGNISCLKYLLNYAKRIFPRISSSFIQSSLVFASFYEYLDIIIYLVKNGGKFDDIQSPNTPLINSLISGSISSANFYLSNMPKIPEETIVGYFEDIFAVEYSFPIIQLLVNYIGKTILDFKEILVKLAVNFDVHQFFDDLKDNKISFDFIKVDIFDETPSNYDLFTKVFELGAPFNFDANNKVLLKALKSGNLEFVRYAISKGAVLSNDIIDASGCLESDSRFYRKEDLITILLNSNVDISKYTDFLFHLINSCGNKTFVYELLALKAVDKGAVVTKEAVLSTIKIKWSRLFKKIYDKDIHKFEPSDISLIECRFNKYSYNDILDDIFSNQPALVDELITQINLLDIKSNVADMVKSFKNKQNDDIILAMPNNASIGISANDGGILGDINFEVNMFDDDFSDQDFGFDDY